MGSTSFARSAAEVPRVARIGADDAEVPAASARAGTTSAASAGDAILLTRRLIRKGNLNLSRKRRIYQISTFGMTQQFKSLAQASNLSDLDLRMNKNSSNFIEKFVKAKLES